MADQRRSGKKVQYHPMVEALVGDPSQPPEPTVKLFGYPGRSTDANSTRLWLDGDLTSYVDVPNDAILYTRTLPDDAGTVLWVAAAAKLGYASVRSHSVQADFVSGSVTQAHLGTAAQAAPLRTPTLGVACGAPTQLGCLPTHLGQCASHLGGCPSLPFCPSEAMVPSHCAPCVSLPVCPSEAMAPSHCAPCVSLPVCPSEAMSPCASVQAVCHTPPTTTALCAPSVHAVCPSVQRLCPTPTAVGRCGGSALPACAA